MRTSNNLDSTTSKNINEITSKMLTTVRKEKGLFNSCGYIEPDLKPTIYQQKTDNLSNRSVDKGG